MGKIRTEDNGLFTAETVKFIIYVAGVYGAFMLFGIAQERVHTVEWGPDGAKFRFPLFLISVQSFCNLVVAFTCMSWTLVVKKLKTNETIRFDPFGACPWYGYAITGLSCITSMLCSNAALQHVDYPTQVLAKSCKMVAVMLAGVLLVRKRYKKSQYTSVLILTVGIFVFSFFRSSGKSSGESSIFGVLLLLASLTGDGITATLQDKFVSAHAPSSLQLMMSINAFSFLYTLIALISTGQFFTVAEFMAGSDRRLFIAILAFGITSGCGQVFLFGLIRDFGSLSATITTTTRKFFSILLSVVLYSHSIPPLSWIGVAMVFFGLGFNIYAKARKPSAKPAPMAIEDVLNPFPDPYEDAAHPGSIMGSRRGSVVSTDSDLESVVSLAFSASEIVSGK